MNSKTKTNIIILSSLLFVIASIVEMTLHEFGHFVAAIIVHSQDISIHHNYVSNTNDGISLHSVIFIKAAGPLVSLLIGMLFHYVCSRQSKRNVLFLFNLYMSAFGYIGFFGYLMMAPFFISGDTGYICYALSFPLWLTITIALIGAVILFILINILIKYFVEMGSEEIIERKERRIPFIKSLLLYPLFIGIVITTLLNLPVVTALSLIAPICSPFTFFWAYGNALRKNYPDAAYNKQFAGIDKHHYVLYILFVLIVIMNRLLVNGIYAN